MKNSKRFLIIGITSAVAVIAIISFSFFISAYTSNRDNRANERGKLINDPDTVLTGKTLIHDTLLVVNNHSVIIKICPHRKKGTFLVLHGWNLPADDWCTKTSLCSKVLKKDTI